MNNYIYNAIILFEQVIHPAAGRGTIEKKKSQRSPAAIYPKATPDSLNIRDVIKRQDSFRRNPAP